MKKQPKPIPFQHVIKALLDVEQPFPARYLYRLSDISPEDLILLKKNWPSVSLTRRQAVMEDIQEFNEEDFLLNFFEVGLLAVEDPDPHVRVMAVVTLAEYEGDDLVPLFIHLAEDDSQVEVRVAATAALGRLVYQGELDQLPAASLKQVEACLIRIHEGQDAKQVRLSALESLGFSSLDEVDDLIKKAYQSNEMDWVTSALVAMGRSYNQAWDSSVIAMLGDQRTSIRQEAVRSAGELEITETIPLLKDLLQDSEDSVRQAVIWSMSQIGGEDVQDLLEQMLEVVEDEDEEQLIESALENLEITEGFNGLAIFDLDEGDEEEEDEIDEE